MKLSLVSVLASCIVALLPSTAQAQGTGTASQYKITAAAIWQPPADFVKKANDACGKMDSPQSFDVCFMDQMADAGVPPQANTFTGMLYAQNQQVVILHALKNFGPVDAAQVWYPLAQTYQYGLFLVNGEPRILDVDDEKKLDEKAMKAGPLFHSIEQKYPQVEVGPTDRSSSTPWPNAQPLPDGGIELIVTYTLLNGCDACDHIGLVRFGWDFDAKGKFLRTVYLPMPPTPKVQHPGH